MKPRKVCRPNGQWPLHDAFRGYKWEDFGASKHCGVLMAAMIAAYDIRSVLEIGIGNGVMSELLAKALSSTAQDSGLLVSCDKNQAACDKSLERVASYPIEHRTLTGKSSEALGGVFDTFGLVFIDGDHSYESVKHDIEASSKLLERCGLIFVHDYSTTELGVIKAIQEFVSREKWPMFFLPQNNISMDYRSVILQKPWEYF